MSEQDPQSDEPPPSAQNGLKLVYTLGNILALISAGWLILSPLLRHMGRPWPCAVIGVVILSATSLAFIRPSQRRNWALVAMIAAVVAILLGQGAVVPGIIGVVAASFIMLVSSETTMEGTE